MIGRRRQWSLVAAAAGLLLLLIPVQDYTDGQRRQAVATTTAGADVDPSTFVTTVLLAGFRAIAIDIAWIRADYFQRSGDLWAVKPTLELIVDLQPSIEVVWSHIGWHLAFNMSLEEQWDDHEARWGWVEAAIGTLEEGLERNPRSYLIRQELAWVISCKCLRTDLDDAAGHFGKRYRETTGRDPLDAIIDYLEEARRIPEHVEAVLPRCPNLIHALRLRYHHQVEAWKSSPTREHWDALVETRERMLEQREHLIVDHARTRARMEQDYPLPPLPVR